MTLVLIPPALSSLQGKMFWLRKTLFAFYITVAYPQCAGKSSKIWKKENNAVISGYKNNRCHRKCKWVQKIFTHNCRKEKMFQNPFAAPLLKGF
jgi:hypothetical protein